MLTNRISAFTRSTLLALTAAGSLLSANVALAHEDDGKVRDRQKAFRGPVYREGEVTKGQGSVAGTFDSQGIVLKSWHPLNTIDAGATSGNDCWGYVSPSGREYALMCVSNGMAVYEVTDPVNSSKIGFISGPQSLWRDVKVYGQFAYVVTEGGAGIQVVSLQNVDQGSVTLVNTITTGGGLATHNVAINEQSGYLYRCGGGSSGLRIYNLANPASPVFVGEWSTHYVHDAQIVSYTSGPYAGKEIAFCCAGLNGGNVETGLYIVDVTNKAAPVQLSRILYPSARYSHQGWLTEDRKLFLLGDELDEGATQAFSTTHVINVENLASPAWLGQFANSTPAITHNCYTHQRKMFQANYRSGLRVFSVESAATPSSVQEVAYFDTYPGDDAAQFNGLWSCYPYFPSGTIIGSDLERGLFVWRFGGPVATFSVANAPALVNPAGGTTVDVVINPAQGQTLNASSAKLKLTVGGTSTSVALSPIGSNTFRGTFPAIPCTSTVSYAFEIENTSGDVTTDATRSATSAVSVATAVDHNFEAASGWTGGVAGDTATSGQWVRVDPVGTSAQPENDNSATGALCWVTGQGTVGGAAGAADVDGGITTLLSPAFDMSQMDEPTVEYWYWYSNNLGGAPNADSMPVEISNNGGTSWVMLEDVATNNGAWTKRSWRVRDFVTPTANMRVRFVARDLATGSLVEAGVDDFKVINVDCSASIPGDLNGDGVVGADDLAQLLGSWGATGGPADINGSGLVDATDLAILIGNWG
jgi:choice-of-anchor B domain-containing protein